MTVLREVLQWSAELPDWQRDALRRTVSQPALTPGDLDELTELCKLPHGLHTKVLSPTALTEAHLPTNASSATVNLVSIMNTRDVNALASGQKLAFAESGLTVVYGDNGSGKSGYARILKRACRARGSGEPVLPNALNDAAGRPTADLQIKISGVESSHTWREGDGAPSELGAISVFDASAAHVYVSQQTDVAYRPLGLDILDSLANVCGEVRGRLEKEQADLSRQRPSWPVLPAETEAARLLGSLTALTKDEQIDRLTRLTDDEQGELSRLELVLADARANDPAKRTAEIRLQAGRLRRFTDRVKSIAAALSPTAIADIIALRDQARAHAAIAEATRTTFEKGVILREVGGATWRKLWDAARAYSEHSAYRGREFPFTGEEARCVLCHQELSDDARKLLKTFGELVHHESQTKADSTKAELAARRKALADLPISGNGDLIEEVNATSASVGSSVAAFFDAALKVRDQALDLLDGEGTSANLALVEPTKALEDLCLDLDRRAADTEKAADPEARRVAERRLAELKARSLLVPVRAAIRAEMERLRKINAYDSCLKDAGTAAITRRSTELTKKYVSDDLMKAFKLELTRVGFVNPELTLVPKKGQRGALYHQIQLVHAPHASVPKIVSEGEGRCLALAAFLAELQIAGHCSAIVFDDPVCSLDHCWRQRVADRLVHEGRTRQVIVFTHELVFLSELLAAAENQECHVRSQWLSRQPAGSGCVEDDLPWSALSTSKRLGLLKKDWQTAEKLGRTQGRQVYEPLATSIYARLRQTWERAVEEILLNDVVMRFRPSVETKRLKKLAVIKPADADTIETAMTKCSRWEGGHDQARAVNAPVPDAQELLADITALEVWVAEVRSRA